MMYCAYQCNVLSAAVSLLLLLLLLLLRCIYRCVLSLTSQVSLGR
jgi:hypothetical protein